MKLGRTVRRPRTVRWITAIAVAVGPFSYSSATVLAAAPCWQPPVDAPVRDPFRTPSCPYCAGNRGIEYATTAGATIRSVAAGRVSFAGAVAGTKYVVVEVASGWKITYGNVESALRANDVVVANAAIGRAVGAFHFGIRVGDVYLDPARYLGVLQYRARLVPTDGSRGNDPGPPKSRCGTASSTPWR